MADLRVGPVAAAVECHDLPSCSRKCVDDPRRARVSVKAAREAVDKGYGRTHSLPRRSGWSRRLARMSPSRPPSPRSRRDPVPGYPCERSCPHRRCPGAWTPNLAFSTRFQDGWKRLSSGSDLRGVSHAIGGSS